ncbi:MAG: iron-sulfur protein [Ilumatobacteraceae bacterium]|nr:iron-sulfur protein [Ilumatobacteraceae bacterium]
MTPADMVARIGSNASLDSFTKPVKELARKLSPAGPVKDILSGTWLGHQLHPMLTDVAIGSFTSATILDVIGGRRATKSANTLAIIGALSVVPTAASGLADWSDTNDPETRIGAVHAVSNLVGVGLYAASIVARHRGNRLAATVLGGVGMGVMSVGGYLGGHLTLVRGVGVNNTFAEEATTSWTDVMADDDLTEDKPVVRSVDGKKVLLHRSGRSHLAISNRCSHAGGPLNEGELTGSGRDVCVACPWHGSTFRMDDGSVVHGPATVPQPAYETRVHDGQMEIRSV